VGALLARRRGDISEGGVWKWCATDTIHTHKKFQLGGKMISAFKKKEKKKNHRHSPLSPSNPAFDTYLNTLRRFTSADFVVVILDARNPVACRYGPFEELLSDRLILVINKIDLAPRESSLGWLHALRQICPAFALQATKDASCLTNFFTAHRKANRPTNVFVTGLPQIGKKTLAESIGHIEGVQVAVSEPWVWMEPTPDLVALAGSDLSTISAKANFGAREFLSRCSIHSLMEVFQVPFFNDVDMVLSAIDKTKRAASLEFFRGMAAGKWKYFTIPPAKFSGGSLEGLGDDQILSLRNACRLEASPCRYVILSYGTQSTIKPTLITRLHDLVAQDAGRLKGSKSE
jgi:hypothetical protein